MKLFAKPQTVQAEPEQGVVNPSVMPQALTETQSMVDELATLVRTFEAMDGPAMVAKIADLKKKLVQSVAETTDPNLPAVIHGGEYDVTFAAMTRVYELTDKKELMLKVGTDTFVNMAKIGVTELKKVLSLGEMEKYGQYVRGQRNFKGYEKK